MRYNVPKSCATRVCCACVDLITCVAVRYLILRTGCEKHGRKNPLPYSFSKRSPVSGLRQIRKQGKGRSSKRKENRRLSFLFALRRGRGESPRSAERSSPLRFSEKLPARQGRTRLRQFVCLGHLVPRKEKHRRIASTVLKVCTFTQIAAAYRHPYAPAPAGPVPDDRAR